MTGSKCDHNLVNSSWKGGENAAQASLETRSRAIPQPRFRLIDPALVFSVNVAWGAVPTSPLTVAPAPEWFTVTGKFVLIEPTSVVAFTWKLAVAGRVISIDPALVSKSYVPVVPMAPVKLMLPAFVLNVELPVSEAWVAPMVPALLSNDIFPRMPLTVMLPAFVVSCRSVAGGTVIVKSTLVELKKLNLPDLWTATFTVLPLWP